MFLNSDSGTSTTLKVVIAVLVIVVVGVAGFFAWTYPREVASFPVTLAVGASTQQVPFDVPMLDNAVQVQVDINSGASVWTASIVNSDGDTVWSHQTAQGGQTTFTSEWNSLPSGSYNFTFATVGGDLDSQITVKAKGGLW
ncbi:MAG: hypothetical protein NWF00_01585 [Candidatus Bathyarchaeota archaeon]|nr:hypothetical protein [Candidatus Bathyarchaeota archaeon]